MNTRSKKTTKQQKEQMGDEKETSSHEEQGAHGDEEPITNGGIRELLSQIRADIAAKY